MSESTGALSAGHSAARKTEILNCIDDAIPENQHESTDVDVVPEDLVQDTLDVLWDLQHPDHGPVIGVKRNRELLPKSLRRLTMKLTTSYNKLPHAFYLKGVVCTELETVGAGGYADVYIGHWEGKRVALKRIRAQSKDMELYQKFHKTDQMVGQDRIKLVNRWLYQVTLGLIYLHGEDLVHGDLHGENILVDDDDNAVLTDFGMGVLADANPNRYASKHGGAYQYLAPELQDPDAFKMDDGRQTIESDIYALGGLCIELYAEHAPFGDARPNKVFRLVVIDDTRPARPVTKDGIEMSATMWDLTMRCMVRKPEDRPPAHTVADQLKHIIDAGDAGIADVPPNVAEEASGGHSIELESVAPKPTLALPELPALDEVTPPPIHDAERFQDTTSALHPTSHERDAISSSVTQVDTPTTKTTDAAQASSTSGEVRSGAPAPPPVGGVLSEKRPALPKHRQEDPDDAPTGCCCIIA
ncbi:hypothetical protein EUX98_g7030 [Antrodiella citrinella]|uniref:Protein kinase domain-containing protein n=1 Tax=Antrodiella citrinella TaxID=2447956 RepID=A0A4S4MQ23_9APHY|nr:hypothetical protein EUX98_g7030 [Antrodiella citrinella]